MTIRIKTLKLIACTGLIGLAGCGNDPEPRKSAEQSTPVTSVPASTMTDASMPACAEGQIATLSDAIVILENQAESISTFMDARPFITASGCESDIIGDLVTANIDTIVKDAFLPDVQTIDLTVIDIANRDEYNSASGFDTVADLSFEKTPTGTYQLAD